MAWRLLFVIVLVASFNKNVEAIRSAFDEQLYQDVLDEELCQEQLVFLSNHELRYQFYDASFRIPSGIKTGHINDLGDYYQCLSIDQVIDNMPIQGKYCTVLVPMDENAIDWPSLPEWNITWPELPDLNITLPNITLPDIEAKTKVDKRFADLHGWAQNLAGLNGQSEMRIFPSAITTLRGSTLAVCVPKVCSPRQAIEFMQELTPFLNVSYNEFFCRLPNDKPFAPADYVAITIFSIIGLLIGISTTYDLLQQFHYERDPSQISPLYRSFSVYTNTRRMLTFNSSPGALECIDGVRSISMLWVVVGHTYSFTLLGYVHNMRDIFDWMTDISSTWINAAPITVDTFFLLSGILVVYTTVGKISRARFLRTLHLFYINRLLRMFPLLAAVVLLQASVFNHVADGPFWNNVAAATENCRSWWWSVLLHVQNYTNTLNICLPQTWYLSVDTQLYFVSPLVIFWLFGHPRFAWISLTFIILVSLVTSSTYSFMYNFSAALANTDRIAEFSDYITVYYLNTLTRAPPFFIGMVYGYMLHVYRDRKIKISRVNVFILWVTSMLMMAFCVVSMYPVMQPGHDAQIFDNFLNAYMRAIWAIALGWLIFACSKGYGGPVNWFLSLQLWKLPARLSFAVYLIHIPVIMIANGTWVKTHYFSTGETFYRFGSDLIFSFGAAFILCVAVDAPCSTLQKLLLGGGKKRAQKPRQDANGTAVVIENDKYIKTSL